MIMAKVISIQQPWASLICPPDWLYELEGQGKLELQEGNHLPKNIENRVWDTQYRGPLIIHASKGYDLASGLVIPRAPELPRGCLIGMVNLIDILKIDTGLPWHENNMFGWVLSDQKCFSKPIFMAGRLGLWNISDDFLKGILIYESTRVTN
jgi:hypothetical protein